MTYDELVQRRNPRFAERLQQQSGAYQAAYLRHSILDARALLLRRGLTENLRASLAEDLPILEREARARGVDTHGWREYPESLSFGARVGPAHGVVEHIGPPPAPKRNRRDDRPPAAPAGDMLDAVEHELISRMAAMDG